MGKGKTAKSRVQGLRAAPPAQKGPDSAMVKRMREKLQARKSALELEQAKTKNQKPTKCIASHEQTLRPCNRNVARAGDACPAHQFWDRRQHAAAGLPGTDDAQEALKWHNECANPECKEEQGEEAMGCELCPRLFHPGCDEASATFVSRADGNADDEAYVCSKCVENKLLFNKIPAKLRTLPLPQPKKSSDQIDEDMLNKDGTSDKRATPESPTVVSDTEDTPTATMVDLSKATEDELQKYIAAARAKRARSSEPAGSSEPAPGAGSAATNSSHAELRARALAMSSGSSTNRYAHKAGGCNDDKCPVNKRDGSYDISAGDRIDGKYTSALLQLLGPQRCSAYSPSQRDEVARIVAEKRCGKKDYETPTYNETMPLADQQVVVHLEHQSDAHVDGCQQNAQQEPPVVCETRLDLVENINDITAECKTIMLDSEAYPDISAREYVRAVLYEAQRGRDVTRKGARGEPRANVLNSIMLRRSTSKSTNVTPVKQQKQQSDGGYAGGNSSASLSTGRACYNCQAYGIKTTAHTANDCTKPCKIPCRMRLPDGSECKALHKRKDHK